MKHFGKTWFNSRFCHDGSNCKKCRRRHGGVKWRTAIERQYFVPHRDFECPYGRPWIEDTPAETVDYSMSPRAKFNEAVEQLAAYDQAHPVVIRINEKLRLAEQDITDNNHCYPCVEKVYKRFVKTFDAMIRLVEEK